MIKLEFEHRRSKSRVCTLNYHALLPLIKSRAQIGVTSIRGYDQWGVKTKDKERTVRMSQV